MDIDIERLKTDAAYWDEVAPEGAETFGQEGGIFIAGWHKSVGGKIYFMELNGDDWKLTYPMERELIHRPIQKPEVEWDGEGLPPVGRDFEIDVQMAILWHAGDAWRQCEILAHRGGKAICWVPTCNSVVSTSNAKNFRPIRTKEQRQAEEVVNVAYNAVDKNNEVCEHANDIEAVVHAILARYSLEPKDD